MKSYCIPISVKGIVFQGDRVWLRKNERNEWELPGGKLDEWEQPEQTVVREMSEELGFVVLPLEVVQTHLYTIHSSHDESHGVLVVSYVCDLIDRAGEFELWGEAGEAQFNSFSFEEVKHLEMPEFYKIGIQKAWEVLHSTRHPKRHVTVDCVVFDESDRLLLIRRKNYPFKGMYALPGGFVDEDETVPDAARRELREETGIQARSLELVGVYSGPHRDPRHWTITIAYLVVPQSIDVCAGDDAAIAEFVQDWKSEKLAFDHNEIVADAVKLKRGKGL
jgi:8-oxo-dGTP diphosphatase